MSATRFTNDQYGESSITGDKLVEGIQIPVITYTETFALKSGDINMLTLNDDGDLYIRRNLEVGGTVNSVTTTVNTMEIADSEIILNAGVSTPYIGGARIAVDRGNPSWMPGIEWSENDGYWILSDTDSSSRLLDETYGDEKYLLSSGITSDYPLISKKDGQKSWAFNRTASDNLILEPSVSINNIDWDTAHQIIFTDVGGLQTAGNITVSGNRITLGNGSYLENETNGFLNIKADGEMLLYATSSTTRALDILTEAVVLYDSAAGDYGKVGLFFNGKIGFGPGTAAQDTWLYRESVNQIKTDGSINMPAGQAYKINNNNILRQDSGTSLIRIGTDYISIKSDGNVGIGNTNPTYKLDVTGSGHITGDLTVDGAINGNISLTGFKYARITYPVGKSVATYTHNLGTTDYIVQVTPNSPETHFYYSNLTANSIDVCLDDPAYEELIVDVAVIQNSSITAITATV